MKNIKVFLLDDDLAFSELFKENLLDASSRENIEFHYADNLEYDNLKELFDIYFIDHNIYGKPVSLDVVKKIKSNGSGVKIFVISNYGDFALLKNLMKAGIDGFIDKGDIDYLELANFIKSVKNTKILLKKLNDKFCSAKK